ncbi:MAG: EscU/YscU/HrcU family type III secretion system export apparatus switch protein [Planctomycetota bacterium]|jgi:flagellar biosynthesis protein
MRDRHKRLTAAALGYDRGADSAPRLLARGKGEVAQRILERAREHKIPIEEDPDLLQRLASLEIGYEIPVEAYQAVAQILAFLYRKNAT